MIRDGVSRARLGRENVSSPRQARGMALTIHLRLVFHQEVYPDQGHTAIGKEVRDER